MHIVCTHAPTHSELLPPPLPLPLPGIGPITDEAGMVDAARQLQASFGCTAVLVKGGHLAAVQNFKLALVDVLFDGTDVHFLRGPRIATENTHGTGEGGAGGGCLAGWLAG